MDRVDLIILAMLILATVRGINLGFLRLSFSTVGFGVGLFIGSYLTVVLFHFASISNSSVKLILILLIETALGICASLLFEFFAIHITRHAQGARMTHLDKVFGGLFEVISIILLIWLVAPSLFNVQADRVGYFVTRSAIVGKIDGFLPSPPNFIARLESIVSPNNSPNVFAGIEPEHTTVEPNSSVDSAIITQDEQSVVKVQGDGCGGLVEGSAFVVSPGIVVTNAHVIAGIKSPEVIDQYGTYRATPIWFDPNLDLALLRVNGLSDSALQLSTNTLTSGTGIVVLGYPNNGPLTSQGGAVIDEVTAVGQNIYDQGSVSRNIYEIQADVEPGNSGGPMIESDGSVGGIVFAKSVDQNNVGYALLTSDVQSSIQKAISQNSVVGDGSCAD